jgi:hypothetical protein
LIDWSIATFLPSFLYAIKTNSPRDTFLRAFKKAKRPTKLTVERDFGRSEPQHQGPRFETIHVKLNKHRAVAEPPDGNGRGVLEANPNLALTGGCELQRAPDGRSFKVKKVEPER